MHHITPEIVRTASPELLTAICAVVNAAIDHDNEFNKAHAHMERIVVPEWYHYGIAKALFDLARVQQESGPRAAGGGGMIYRVWLADDGDPNHETLRDIMFGECALNFVERDNDLLVWDFEVQDIVFEHWLQQFGPVIAWERLS
jgi:hypothetical protein